MLAVTGLAMIAVGGTPALADEETTADTAAVDESVDDDPTTTTTTTSTTPTDGDVPTAEPAPAVPDPATGDESTNSSDAPASESPADTTSLQPAREVTPTEDAPPSGGKGGLAPAQLTEAAVGDIDNDGVLDASDNCQATYNPLQGDHDSDGLGNACDPNFGEQDGVAGNIFENRLCQAITLDPEDDNSSQKIFFPTPLNFFGVEQRFAFVNNNGNMTFVSALDDYTPFEIDADTPPIIAPFFADVDTRPVGGGKVTYGVALHSPTFGGRNVTCVTWDHVGYFNHKVDKRNTFQLLIVERSDIALGDFDIYFNYAGIQWETGDVDTPTDDGLGGTSAGVGFSSGTGLDTGFFSMPCSLVNGGCLDTNNNTGLRNTSTNSPIRGRHIFRVRGGGEQFKGSVEGLIKINDPPPALPVQPLVNALVELCEKLDTGAFGNCRSTFSVATGGFDIRNLPPGDYRLRVFPKRIGGANTNPRTVSDGFRPSGLGIDPLPIEVKVLNLTDGETRVVNLETTSGTPPPPGVTLGTFRNGSFFPHINAGRATTFKVAAPCPGGGTFQIFQNGQSVATGSLLPIGGGFSQGTVTVATPGLLDIHVDFPGCTNFTFNAYVDPSGLVLDQDGVPIPGARVVLMRSEFPEGPFEPVPSGSEVMSPSNRFNPDATDAEGFFGWDVISGFYRVDASATGCTDGSTAVLPVPPEQVDLRIVLTCERPTTTTTDPEPVAANELARTGSDISTLSLAGLSLLLTGALLLVWSHRVRLRGVGTSTSPHRET